MTEESSGDGSTESDPDDETAAEKGPGRTPARPRVPERSATGDRHEPPRGEGPSSASSTDAGRTDEWGRIPMDLDGRAPDAGPGSTDGDRSQSPDGSDAERSEDGEGFHQEEESTEAGDSVPRSGSDSDGAVGPEESNPYAPEPKSTPVEPERPSLEGAAFVVLGVLAMILVMVRIVGLLPA